MRELTWIEKGLRPFSCGVPLLGLLGENWPELRRDYDRFHFVHCLHRFFVRENWPELRRDYDFGLFRLRCQDDRSMRELTWIEKGLRPQIILISIKYRTIWRELTWIEKGLRPVRHFPNMWKFHGTERTDLNWEGITTIKYLQILR